MLTVNALNRLKHHTIDRAIGQRTMFFLVQLANNDWRIIDPSNTLLGTNVVIEFVGFPTSNKEVLIRDNVLLPL